MVQDATLLAKLSVTELKKIAKERKIAGYSKLKKPELIERLSQSMD